MKEIFYEEINKEDILPQQTYLIKALIELNKIATLIKANSNNIEENNIYQLTDLNKNKNIEIEFRNIFKKMILETTEKINLSIKFDKKLSTFIDKLHFLMYQITSKEKQELWKNYHFIENFKEFFFKHLNSSLKELKKIKLNHISILSDLNYFHL